MTALSSALVFTAPKAALFVLAGIAAGIFNSIAGGGTLVTFPTLLALGVPAVSANVTSAVGIVPSYLGGIHGFRSELTGQQPRIRRLLPVALVGSCTGAILLLTTAGTIHQSIQPPPLTNPRPVNWSGHEIYPDRLFHGTSLRIMRHDPEHFQAFGGYGTVIVEGWNEFHDPTSQPALPTLVQSDTLHLKVGERQSYTTAWMLSQ